MNHFQHHNRCMAQAHEIASLNTANEDSSLNATLLPSSNVVSKWIRIEKEVDYIPAKFFSDAEKNLKKIVAEADRRFANDSRPVPEKVGDIYKLLTDQGFTLKPFGLDDKFGSFLSYSLARKQLDCDTMSAVVVGIAL